MLFDPFRTAHLGRVLKSSSIFITKVVVHGSLVRILIASVFFSENIAWPWFLEEAGFLLTPCLYSEAHNELHAWQV